MNWKTHFFREDEKPFLSAERGILILPTFAETDMILTRATTMALPPIVTKRYSRGESAERIAEQMRSLFPAADKKQF